MRRERVPIRRSGVARQHVRARELLRLRVHVAPVAAAGDGPDPRPEPALDAVGLVVLLEGRDEPIALKPTNLAAGGGEEGDDDWVKMDGPPPPDPNAVMEQVQKALPKFLALAWAFDGSDIRCTLQNSTEKVRPRGSRALTMRQTPLN